MWLQLLFGLYVFFLCYSSGEVHDPLSPWSLEPRQCAVNREEKWISMGQSLLEPARAFPWVSACFHSAPFIADFLKELSSPLGARFVKRAEQVGGCLGKSVGKCRAAAAGSGALWRSWEEISWGTISKIGSHLLSYRTGCQVVMAPERCSADLLWRMGPAEICLPSALLKHSSYSLTLWITPALNHTRSGFTFWLSLLYMHSPEPRATLKPRRQHWCPQDSSCASQALQCWSLRLTHTKLLSSSPSVQWRQWFWPSPGRAVQCRS